MGYDNNNSFAPAVFTQRSRSEQCGQNCDVAVDVANVQNNACSCNGQRGGCGDETHVYFDTCEGSKEINVCGTCQDDQALGRVLDVTTTLRNVCPGRRSAVGLTLNEVDNDGTEYARGFRAISVPAHSARCAQDITLESVRFILPEDLSLQRRRHFVVRTEHHYLDADSIWG